MKEEREKVFHWKRKTLRKMRERERKTRMVKQHIFYAFYVAQAKQTCCVRPFEVKECIVLHWKFLMPFFRYDSCWLTCFCFAQVNYHNVHWIRNKRNAWLVTIFSLTLFHSLTLFFRYLRNAIGNNIDGSFTTKFRKIANWQFFFKPQLARVFFSVLNFI